MSSPVIAPPRTAAEALDALRSSLAPTFELTHAYSPRGGARELLAARHGEILLDGPAGVGKSRAALEKLNIAMLKYPGARGLIVRQVRDTLGATALKTFEEFVAAEQLRAGAISYHGPSYREPARYRYSNGSEVWLAGMDKPSKIMSTEFDMIYVQEATELSIDGWEALTTRLGRRDVMPYAQLIADCNPQHPAHWLKLRADAGTTRMIPMRHADNPILFDDDGNVTERGAGYLAKLDALTGVRRQRLRDGLWVASEGVIWTEFDPAEHVIDPFPIPDDWTRFWSVDFGMVHPFVLQCWAEDGDGRLYLYRQLQMTGRLVEDHARQVLDLVAPGGVWKEPKPRRIFCDHDAEDRATLRRHLGISNHPADKRVTVGLEAVEVRWRERRLFIFRDSLVERDPALVAARRPTCVQEEIGGYVWDAGTSQREAKEQPVKRNDDGCDALRYVVADRDLRAKGRNIYRTLEV